MQLGLLSELQLNTTSTSTSDSIGYVIQKYRIVYHLFMFVFS